MAVVVGRMLAILEAQTAQFDARMDAAGKHLTRWTNSTTSGRRGTMMLHQAFQQLAFQAAGIPGPIGKAVSAVGLLGVGGPVTIGVLAGVGAIVTLFRLATQETDNLRVSTDKLNATYRDITAGGRPLVALQNRIIDAIEAQSTAQAKLDRFRFLAAQRGDRGDSPKIIEAERNLAAATRVVEALRGQQGVTRQEVGQQWAENFLKGIRDLRVDEQLAALIANRTAFESRGTEAAAAWRKAFMAMFTDHPPVITPRVQTELRPAVDANGQPLFPRIPHPAGRPGAVFSKALFEYENRVKPEPSQLTPQFAQMMLFSLMAARGGGTGGALAAGGGLLTGLSGLKGVGAAAGPLGWVGFGLSALGSLIGNNADKNAEKVVRALERMGKEVGLDRVTVVFTGPDGHQVRKSLAELEEGDAVERVPGPVGAN